MLLSDPQAPFPPTVVAPLFLWPRDRTNHEVHCRALDIDRDDVRRDPPPPLYEVIVALLPCYWIYWEAGSLVRAVLDATKATASGLHSGELDAMRRHFLVTSRYEWMFWEMGYRLESWPL